MLNQIRKERGFTIIELLIVIAIIGILATLVLTNFRGAQAKGRDTVRQNDLNSMYQKLEEYYNDEGSYPTETFSATLFPGIDEGAFDDPDGNTVTQSAPSTATTAPSDPYTTGTKPTGAQYTYAGYDCDTSVTPNTCAKYVLYGWKEVGDAADPSFSRDSLN